MDPDAIGDIFARRREFVRPIEHYKILEVFGPCLSTADANNWPRHRKALAAPFNESIMSFVWDESLRQAKGMVASWSSPTAVGGGIPSVQQDTRSLSLDILAATGFRTSYDFVGSADDKQIETGTYRQALQTVLDNVILLMLVPYKVLMFPLMPKSWNRIGRAGDAFKKYMVQMLEEETQAVKQGRAGSGGIMTSFLHALDAHQVDPNEKPTTNGSTARLPKGLSVEEIFGNIFVINFAGHDTTANTLAFAMLLLAVQPEVQDWIAEEVNQVARDVVLEDGTYEQLFSRLLRCKAVLYETLRLYPPIPAIPKGTDHRSQILKCQDRELLVPPHTVTSIGLLACHTHPDNWPNPLKWDPFRWVQNSTHNGETFYTPPKNTFFPWSDGPQNCPGKKFAEVEFVATLAYVLRNHRLEIKRLHNESTDQAQKRVLATVNDVNMELLIRMNDADRVKLLCVPAKS